MRWGGQRESDNIEDRRGMSGGLAMGGGGIGIVILALIVWLCGGDPRQLLENLPDQTAVEQPANTRPAQDDQRKFASLVLGSTEDVWGQVLPSQAGKRYTPPKLVLYSGRTSSGCGPGGRPSRRHWQ